MNAETLKKPLIRFFFVLLIFLLVPPVFPAGAAEDASKTGKAEASGEKDAAANPNRITRQGLTVELSVRPTHGESDKLVAGDWAEITFRVTDAISGKPVKGSYPGAWFDLTKAWQALGDKVMECKDRVALYLQGIVGVRPVIDLNSQYLMVMNRNNSISVIDPKVGITGITNLLGQVNLKQPGADWVKTEDEKRIFVSMPLADQVALVDTDTFKVTANLDGGEQPTRVELQGDERLLWVGNSGSTVEESGVTVIDADELKWLAFIPTGRGHHEIGFSGGDRYAFVTNRDDGTVSVIDVQSLKKVKDLETGPNPIALAFSPLSKVLYVADSQAGTVTVVDPDTLEIRARVEAKPGLGPLRFSQDGRWGMAVNTAEHTVSVIDAATNRVVHTISVGVKPYQVTFTDSYGYVRSLGTGDVGLIPLSELEGVKTPPVTYIQTGQGLPGAAAEISIADSIVPSTKHAAVYIVNPLAGTIHYYMEGMVASSGAFRNYGNQPRAVELVDRSLQEREPGVYAGQVKIPVEGTYDVAFLMDAPSFVHCFSATVEPNPELRATTTAPMAIEYRIADRRVPAGGSTTVKFKLSDPVTGKPRGDLRDVTVLYYGSDGRGRRVVPARPLGEGLYEADVKVDRVITYYLFVGSRSTQLKYGDLPFASLMGTPAPVKGGGAKGGAASRP